MGKQLINGLICAFCLLPAYSCGEKALATDYSGISASPDYSYDSNSSRDTYSSTTSSTTSTTNRTMTPSYRKPTSDSTRTFSSNVYISRPNVQSGFRPQPLNKSSSYNTQYSTQSAYYKTRPYKY